MAGSKQLNSDYENFVDIFCTEVVNNRDYLYVLQGSLGVV